MCLVIIFGTIIQIKAQDEIKATEQQKELSRQYTEVYAKLITAGFNGYISKYGDLDWGKYAVIRPENSLNFSDIRDTIRFIFLKNNELYLLEPWYENDGVFTTIWGIGNTSMYILINYSKNNGENYITLSAAEIPEE